MFQLWGREIGATAGAPTPPFTHRLALLFALGTGLVWTLREREREGLCYQRRLFNLSLFPKFRRSVTVRKVLGKCYG